MQPTYVTCDRLVSTVSDDNIVVEETDSTADISDTLLKEIQKILYKHSF